MDSWRADSIETWEMKTEKRKSNHGMPTKANLESLGHSHSLHPPVEVCSAVDASPMNLQWTVGGYTGDFIITSSSCCRSSHVSFSLFFHPLKLCGNVDVRRAATPSTARAATATARARRGGVSALFNFLSTWLVHTIFRDNVFSAPNNQADL